MHDGPPEEPRAQEQRDVLEDVQRHVLVRRVVDDRNMPPDHHDRLRGEPHHERGAGDPRRRIAAPRDAEGQQRRGHRQQQHVLGHVQAEVRGRADLDRSGDRAERHQQAGREREHASLRHSAPNGTRGRTPLRAGSVRRSRRR